VARQARSSFSKINLGKLGIAEFAEFADLDFSLSKHSFRPNGAASACIGGDEDVRATLTAKLPQDARRRGHAMPSPCDHRVVLPLELELRRRITVQQAAELRGISEEAFREHFGHLIEQTTPGRQTVRLGDALGD